MKELADMLQALLTPGVDLEYKPDVPYYWAKGDKIIRLLNNVTHYGRMEGKEFIPEGLLDEED
jgi:ATP-dependent exoDNAse (exonuclease V) alpha subunit